MLSRLVASVILTFLGMGVVFALIRRPPPQQPLTWARAILGATLATGLIVLAFGVVPHEWLTYADAELKWGRRDLLFIDTPVIDVSKQAVRDVVVVGIYGYFFMALIRLWLMWQRRYEMAEERQARQEAKQAKEPKPAGTSAYGRPLTTTD